MRVFVVLNVVNNKDSCFVILTINSDCATNSITLLTDQRLALYMLYCIWDLISPGLVKSVSFLLFFCVRLTVDYHYYHRQVI